MKKPTTPAEQAEATNYPNHPVKETIIRNGSAGAFEATENTLDEHDSDEDNDDRELNKSHY